MQNSKKKIDIGAEMEALLNPNTIQKSAKSKNVKDALDSLSKAADILDDLGLFVIAEAATQMMENIHNKD